jgi:hypothetical protein
MHVVAHVAIVLGAACEASLHAWAAEIEIAIFEAEFLASQSTLVMSGDRESFGAVEKFHRFYYNLNVAGWNIWIFEALTALSNCALCADDVFITKMLGKLESFLGLRINNELDHASMIAQIDKNETTVVATGINPAGQLNFSRFDS